MIRLGLSTSYFSVPDSNDRLKKLTRWNLGSSPLRASYYFSAFANLTYSLITDRTQEKILLGINFNLRIFIVIEHQLIIGKERGISAGYLASLYPTLTTYEVEELSL